MGRIEKNSTTVIYPADYLRLHEDLAPVITDQTINERRLMSDSPDLLSEEMISHHFTINVLDHDNIPISNGEKSILRETKTSLTGLFVISKLLEKDKHIVLDPEALPERPFFPHLETVGLIINSISGFYGQRKKTDTLPIDTANKTILSIIERFNLTGSLDISADNVALIGEMTKNLNHDIKTPLTEVEGFEGMLVEYKDKIDPALRRDFVDKVEKGLANVDSTIKSTFEEISGKDILKPFSFKGLLNVAKTELNNNEVDLHLGFDSIPLTFEDELVNLPAQKLKMFFFNSLRNTLQRDNTKTQMSVYVVLGENENGKLCCTLVVEDRSGGFEPPISDKDGIMRPDKDGNFFGERTTKNEKEGSGASLFTQERLWRKHGIRMVPENVFDPETKEKIGAKIMLEIPLKKISSPNRFALFTEINPIYEANLNLFGKEKNVNPRISIIEEGIQEDNLAAVKRDNPQVVIAQMNSERISYLPRLCEEFPEAFFIVKVEDLSEEDERLLREFISEHKNIQIIREVSYIMETNAAIENITEQINKNRI